MKRVTLLIPMVAFLAIVSWPTQSIVTAADDDSKSGFRAAMGSCLGDPAYDIRWDIDGNGCINAIDVHRWRSDGSDTSQAIGAVNEVILIEDEVTLCDPDETVSVRVRLHNNVTALFGYSLAIRAVPTPTATGSVNVDVAQTNFFPVRHLILADPNGAPLDPLFSIIQPWNGTGVFINANTEDGSTVSATIDVNDVFGEVFFTASSDASGVFQIEFGQATALSDGDGAAVPYFFCGGRIAVARVLPPVADITGDSLVSVPDVLAVINGWGLCALSAPCDADLNCDAVVNVPDLLLVINGWSP